MSLFGPPPMPEDPREVALFLHVLEEVFHHESWSEVEPYAHRAWNHIAMITGVAWEQVRDTLEIGWQLH